MARIIGWLTAGVVGAAVLGFWGVVVGQSWKPSVAPSCERTLTAAGASETDLGGAASAADVSDVRSSEKEGALAGSGGPTISEAGPNQYVVPTSGHVAGSGSTFWVTDMVVHNPGPSAATVNIYFLKEKQDNSGVRGTTFIVSSGRSLKLKDVVEDTFGVTAASGALLVGSTVPVLVASRTFNDQPLGTYGQYVPGQGVASLISGTTPARLVQLTKNASYRTNIGFANLTAASTPVMITLFRGDGSLAGAYAEVIDPWGYKQVTDVFVKANAGLADDAYAVVTSSLTTAKYYLYASVIDGRTGDPITVIPVAPAIAPANAAGGDAASDVPDASTVTVFSDDFEGAYPSPSWYLSHVSGASNLTVNWGRSSFRKAGGLYSWWCVGSGSGSPAPGGNYPPNMGAWMRYGPFSLVGATAAVVELDLWLSKQTGKDVFGVWAATSANGSYSSVYVDPANTGGAFRHEVVPINDFAGAPQVWVAITFTSDASTQFEGAYVDNVVIKKTVACSAPAVPTLTAPAAASSGTAYSVTWSATSPENRYEIQEADNPSFSGASGTAATGTNQAITHVVSAATTFYYRVRALACTPTLQSAWSLVSQTVVSPACPVPVAPVLTAPAVANSGASYALSWTATSPGGTYEIEEATGPSFAGAVRASVSGTTRTYAHTVAAATTYYYRARATVSCGGGLVSAWSATRQTEVAGSAPAGTAAVYVPGAASLTGTGGSNWRTDLEVHNPGTTRASYEIALLTRDQDNPDPLKTTFSLDPGKSVRYGNALQSIFQVSGAATLRVSPTAGRIMVTSRTYDDQLAGTYGQFVAGRTATRAIGYGSSARLVLLSQSLDPTRGFRTNLGLVNVTSQTISVEVKAYRGNGTLIGTQVWSLGPYRSIQRNEALSKDFASGETEDAFLVLRTTTAGASFFAYASVIDNRSNDPIYVPVEVVQ
ncbi:MAG TPA: hypothetical protein PKL08_00955 [Thermoanaerobaculaceae bacterium]|nr:hypothetical protein [Thermoanaerobaculaceae bacterium]